MMTFTLQDIARVTGGKSSIDDDELVMQAISIDTRSMQRGSLFVAIPGAHFDGHDFLGDAKAEGAAAAVVRQGAKLQDGMPCVEVADPIRALGDIAAWWRQRFAIPCVAITGSNGKSTTKEMAAAIAQERGAVLQTEGNFNNLIGLPLTIFRWDAEQETAILEMGMNAPGEISRLTEISQPTVGLITNVTAAHLEKLHTVEAVAHAKGELFEAMGGEGVVVLNVEDPWVRTVAGAFSGERVTFGMQNGCDVQFLHLDASGLDRMDLIIAIRGKDYRATLPVPGVHNVMNALAALAIGVALGIDPERAIERLRTFQPMAMRCERVQLVNGVRVINDSYNANPESMRAAFRTVSHAPRAGRFIAALGDMLELGEASSELHRKLGEEAVGMGVEVLYLIGDFASQVAEGARRAGQPASRLHLCEDCAQLCREVEQEIKSGDVLLVKGSRGMRMETLVDHLKREVGMG